MSAVRPGIQTVTRLLGRRADGTRGLYVAPRCLHTIAEYGSYQYPLDPAPTGFPLSSWERGSGGEVSELPLKQHDHTLDAAHYALHTALGRSRATDAWLDLYLTGRANLTPNPSPAGEGR